MAEERARCTSVLDCLDCVLLLVFVVAIPGKVLLVADETLALPDVNARQLAFAGVLLVAVGAKPGPAVAIALLSSSAAFASSLASSVSSASTFTTFASALAVEPVEGADERAVGVVRVHGLTLGALVLFLSLWMGGLFLPSR
jgi:hypothetical protein